MPRTRKPSVEPLSLPPDVDFGIREILTARALAYSVGQQIWCAECQGILDCREAVEVSGKRSIRVFCGDCWARLALKVSQKLDSNSWADALEIVDGYSIPHPDVDEGPTRASGWWVPSKVPVDVADELRLNHAGPGSACLELAALAGSGDSSATVWAPRALVLLAVRELHFSPRLEAQAAADRLEEASRELWTAQGTCKKPV